MASDVYCDYSNASCWSILYRCVGGHWEIAGSMSCNPPAPTCPPKSTLLPKLGDACGYGWGSVTCEFSTSCGETGTATCNGSSYYLVVDPCSDAGSDAQGEDGAMDADSAADVADGGPSE